jgi:hypothetical protein
LARFTKFPTVYGVLSAKSVRLIVPFEVSIIAVKSAMFFLLKVKKNLFELNIKSPIVKYKKEKPPK